MRRRDFTRKQGYEIIFEQANWYTTGHSRVALSKTRGPDCSEKVADAVRDGE